MAKNNADNVVVQQDTVLYYAPVGEAMPADIAAPIAGNWKSAGYLNADGITLSVSQETQNIEAMQSLTPVKSIVTKQETKLSLGLIEFTGNNFQLAFGGKREGSGKKFVWKFDKTSNSERAYIVEIKEGEKTFRICIPKASNAGEVSLGVTKLDAIALPIELALTDTGTGPFSIQTNVESWAPGN